MKKLSIILVTSFLFLLQSCSDAAPVDAGKLRIKANKAGAYIYIDGDKKGMTGDTGYTNILLAEGEYEVKVEKKSDDGEWIYTKTRSVFLGADSSVKLNFELDRKATEKRKELLAQKHAKQLALDKKSGTVLMGDLMWKRCSEGQRWTGSTCAGSADTYKWQQALDHAKNVDYAGYSDWRLPTIDELHTLVYCSSGKRRDIKRKNGKTITINGEYQDGECLGEYKKPTINQIAFPNTPTNYFWSSSPNADYSSYAWVLNFNYGNDNNNNRTNSNRVRLVRFGQ